MSNGNGNGTAVPFLVVISGTVEPREVEPDAPPAILLSLAVIPPDVEGAQPALARLALNLNSARELADSIDTVLADIDQNENDPDR